MTHPFQHILDAVKAGQHVEFSYPNSGWLDILDSATVAVWHTLVTGQGRFSFRVKPKTISFPGQKEVPAPLRTAKDQYQYFVLEADGSVHEIIFSTTNIEHMNLLKNSAIFASRDAAWLYRDALNNFLRSQ